METQLAPERALVKTAHANNYRFSRGKYFKLLPRGDTPLQLGRIIALHAGDSGLTVEAIVVDLGNGLTDSPLLLQPCRFACSIAQIHGREVKLISNPTAQRWLDTIAANLHQQAFFSPELAEKVQIGLARLTYLSRITAP